MADWLKHTDFAGSIAGRVPRKLRGHGYSFSCCSEVGESRCPQGCVGQDVEKG